MVPAIAFAAPQLPHAFYGQAEINGNELPADSTINARAGGELVGSITLKNNGEYGGPGAYDSKLLAQGNISAGETITFFYSGIKAEQTASFQSGNTEKLDLTFSFSGNISGNKVTSKNNEDISLGSEEEGVTQVPEGTNEISLTNESSLDLSQGVSKSTNNKKTVKIKSSNGEDIEVSNSDNSEATVSIPDETTISSDTNWDGKITSPKDGDSSGSAPSGYQVGSTVVEVGSSDVTLDFDKAVKLTLSNVSGAVGYKPAGSSSWTRITTQCNGVSDPSNINSGECYYQTGGNTVIWTYHFTTFAQLNEEDTDSGSSGGGGGGGSIDTTDDDTEETQEERSDITNDGTVDILDFNQLMVEWGSTDNNNDADINEDNTVDILDFNALMVNWTE